MYRLLFALILRHLPAEGVHRVMFAMLRFTMAIPGVGALWRRWTRPTDPALRQRVLGLEFPGPLGLAAGFDKDGKGPGALLALGFAFVEVGTITAEGQPGNPTPRLFRLPRDRALVNRMGFNNAGAVVAATRLARRRRARAPGGIVGLNIGKTKKVTEDDAIADYVASTALLAPHADYLVVNVSSPNTPGLRNLQAIDRLEPLLRAVRAECDRVSPQRHVPLLVKIAPDLADDDVDAVAALAVAMALDGVIATNTTIARAPLVSDAAQIAAVGAGGLSGAPLKERSLAVLRRLYRHTGTAVPLIAVGGIETVDDIWARLGAGATLVQAYTGLVYGGPSWPRRMHRGLVARCRASGMASIAEQIGRDVPTTSSAS